MPRDRGWPSRKSVHSSIRPIVSERYGRSRFYVDLNTKMLVHSQGTREAIIALRQTLETKMTHMEHSSSFIDCFGVIRTRFVMKCPILMSPDFYVLTILIGMVVNLLYVLLLLSDHWNNGHNPRTKYRRHERCVSFQNHVRNHRHIVAILWNLSVICELSNSIPNSIGS